MVVSWGCFSLNRAGLSRAYLTAPASTDLAGSAALASIKPTRSASPPRTRGTIMISTLGSTPALFLDEGLNYSCAFFEDPVHETIEQATQLKNKLQRCAAKLNLHPGMAVAEISAPAEDRSRSTWLCSLGAHVTAINVSPAQISVALRTCAGSWRSGAQVEFVELDYRKLPGHFDRVVSVGMMERTSAHRSFH